MKPLTISKYNQFNLDDLNPEKRFLFAALSASRFIPRIFKDSTNQLCELTFVDGKQAIVKTCDWNGVQNSEFWLGMQSLFLFRFPQSMGAYEPVYKLLEKNGALSVPKLLGCDSATPDFSGFLYCSKLPNHVLSAQQVTHEMVEQLAVHLAGLHEVQSSSFGSAFKPERSAKDWWPAVFKTIRLLAQHVEFDLSQVSFESEQACPAYFVPILPDLRWDQFLTDSKKLTGLVDLDAVVFGTRELEFVLLEYLLSERQAEVFKKAYTQFHSIPELISCRQPYRWLLFFMNVLGEKSVDAWMQAPTRF